MAHLIAPIQIDGQALCCQPATKRTEAVLGGMAAAIGANEWEIYRAAQDNTVKEGSVAFGICCAQGIEITLTGQIETLNDGYDWIEVIHNGQQVFRHQSTDTSDDPDETVAAGPFTLTLPLDDRPCGHLIEIRGSTGDGQANNDVWWRAAVAIS
jgi:hypothetical protein